MFMEIAWILLMLGLLTAMTVVGLRERKARISTAKASAAATPKDDLSGMDDEIPDEGFGAEMEEGNFEFDPNEFK